MAGKLIVEIDNAGEKRILNQNNIENEINNAEFGEGDEEKKRIAAMCELATWSLTHPDSDHYYTKLTGNDGRSPKWTQDLFEYSQLKDLQESFDRGDRIGLRIPFQVERVSGEIVNTSFSLYLQRNSTIDKGLSQYIRSGITISGIPGLDRKRGIMGFVLIEDEFLSGLLGDAENPSHTEWRTQSKRLHTHFKRGPSVIWFVRDSLDRMVDMLSGSDNKEHPDLLREIFSVELDEAPELPDGKSTKRGKSDTDIPKIKVRDVSRMYRLEQISGGFSIKPVSNDKKTLKTLRVKLAYEVRRGNPLKKYSILDFDVSREPISIDSEGLSISKCINNTIEVAIQEPEFFLNVMGFDTTRDLYVKVSVETEDNDDSKI